MTRSRSVAVALSVVVAFGLACGDSSGPDGGNGNGMMQDITLSGGVQPIFTARCALSGCHTGTSPQEGMNLSAGMAFANIVNVPANQLMSMNRVAPGDPDQSYLVHKIQGTQASVGGSGNQMPLTGCCLSQQDIDTIRAWITAGAQNN